jgi:hypothetical protein
MPAARLHPSPPGGFFGQAGLGLGRSRNVFTTEGTAVRASETGLSVIVGVVATLFFAGLGVTIR